MVFGTTCSLPFDLISEDSPADRTKLTKQVRWLNATRESFVSKMRHAGHPEIFVPKDLQTAHHVYVRADRITDGLSPKWDGPYKVVKRGEHTFTLALGLDELGQKRNEDIALRGLKPAYYDESGRPESLPVRNVPGRNPANREHSLPLSSRQHQPHCWSPRSQQSPLRFPHMHRLLQVRKLLPS